LKLLRPIGDFRVRYLGQFGFLDPPPGLGQAQLHSNRQAWQTFEALKGRSVDGGRLLAAMRAKPDEHASWLATADECHHRKGSEDSGSLPKLVSAHLQPAG
jgi:cytochrome c553